MHEQWAETLMGFLVLVLAVGVLVYSLTVGGVGGKRGGYEVTAKFGQVGSLTPGAAVTVAGVVVGAVSEIRVDPKTYLAVTTLNLDPDVKLPTDSTAKITRDNLLGSVHVAITPGDATDDIEPGGEIENIQGAVDLFGQIGSGMRPQGGGGAAASAATAAPNS